MTFRALLLTSVLEPMIAGVVGDRGPILNLRAAVCVGPDELALARASRPAFTGIQQGSAWVDDDAELVWAVISTPKETLTYAMGTTNVGVEELNDQIADLADYVEEWLSESDVAWGQLCAVPRPELAPSTTWD